MTTAYSKQKKQDQDNNTVYMLTWFTFLSLNIYWNYFYTVPKFIRNNDILNEDLYYSRASESDLSLFKVKKIQGSLTDEIFFVRFRCFNTSLVNPFWTARESADTSQLLWVSSDKGKQKLILNTTHSFS